MIPILSSIIAGQGQISHGRSFALSVSYVLGMAVTYSAAGALTAMAGSQVQAVFQQPWIIASVAALFVVMALAMFGLFEIQMPTAIQSRLSGLANKQKNGSFYGTAVIGALSALIVTTCVAPPLIAALIAIGQSGDVARGSFALFVMAIGMGTPLLLIGASAGKILPKAGPWMNAIKAGFGVLMIGMAIWMLGRVVPAPVTLLMWALLVFMTGVFLGAFESLPPDPKPVRRLGKGVGVLACLYGALMLIGFTLGGDDPLEPIPLGAGGFVGRAAPEEPALPFIEVATVAELESLLGQARAAGQPVMMDFTADWCVSCKEMEEYTFPDPGVVAALEPFMLLRADITANNDDDQALLAWFESYGPPTIAFFDRAGRAADPYRLYSYVKADEFSTHVSAVASL
jgi:thiol:disulfide interchange protein DsbD